MEIPVYKLAQYGVILGTVFYDTKTNKFVDKMAIVDRDLPIQDYLSCEVVCNNTVTVVGKDYSNGDYIVCFGDNMLYSLRKRELRRYRMTNIKVSRDDKFICIDGKYEDLSYLFPDKNIEFLGMSVYSQESSLGVAKKFTATYKDNICIVKFSKLSSQKDLYNEIKYFKLAKLFGVDCCTVRLSTYFGKKCCISELSYDPTKDVFKSFKSTGRNPMEIYKSFSKEERIKFDKLMILDYMVEQQDRHMSNIAVCNGRLYPTFDNGECLGIGGIGYFSRNFRNYVEKLDKGYIRSIFSCPSTVKSKIARVLQDKDEQIMIFRNMRKVGLL